MQFKYCVIGDICYEYLRTEGEGSVKEMNFRYDENIVIVRKYEMFENILDENKMRNASKYNNYILKSKDNSVKLSLENTQDLIDHFWYALSLCHSCSIQQNDDGTEEYICMSPDSIELVKTARDQGWNFIESGSSSIKRIRLGKDGLFRNDIERLQLIEFSSDRKRETVIVRDRGIIKVYVKGADSIVEQRLSKKTPDSILRQCKYYVNKFSAQGFRTLFIAMKILSQSEYDDYAAKLKEALMSEEDKDQKVEAVNNTIETDLFLIGTTIVEDKLQDNVPETIRNLRLSNIKVWMLTGDKMNTAYNIGLSCNLINKEMKTFSICGIEVKKNEDLEVINKDERDQVIIDFAKEFEKFKNQFDSMEKPQFGILVDEKALLTINEDTLIQNIFLGIAKDAVAVICCRVSPLQKSQVVKMMKNYDPNAITLAIGDGGNDVSMIMEAHIGVGIYGEEGMRAVQSSDYAIGEFQCLSPLLFFHGRTNYIRNSECIQYFFYKNFVFTILQFVFGFYCNFTGQTIVDDWFITTFNLIFTSMPLGSRALMDHDLKPDDGEVVNKMLPFMYAENRDNPIFTIKNFLLNLLKGIIHCSINFYIVIYSFMGENFDIKGNLPELWVISVTLFTNVLLIVTTDLLIYTKYHTWINFAIMGVVTVLAYIAFIFAVHHMTLFNSVGTMMNTFSSYKIWIMFIFVCGTCALIDFTILAFNYSFNRTITTLLQLQFNSIGKLNDEEEVPDEIKEKLKLYNQYEDNKTEDDDDKKGNKDRDVSKSRTDFSNNNLLRSRDPSFFRKSNLKDVEKSSGSDRSSFRLDNNTDRERRLTSGSESSEKKNKNSSSVSNSSSSNTDKSRNKKNKLKGKKNIKNNNKIKKKNKSESNSNSNSNSKSNSKNNSSSSKFNSSQSSSDKNKKGNESDSESYNDIDSDIEKDVPKKTMEYMSKKKLDTNNGIKKKNNRKSAQRNDNDDDDIGENYSEEFSENVSRDEKYFFPKQTQPTRPYYFSDEKNHVINRFPK
jgi:phospholipid-translocating P-type ATPase (flippase)